MRRKIFIGTSGWSYGHWEGIFYPEDLKQNEKLVYYAQYFDTVEINSSFYHLHRPATYANWYKKTPKDFLFAVKGSRFISHVKKMNQPQEPLKNFFDSIKPLKEKQGPILWQFPPNFKLNLERLKNFIKFLNKKYKYTFEFRHESWFCQEVYNLFKKHNISLCLASTPSYPYEEVITANFVYCRLHGSKSLYASKYTPSELKEWAKKIKKWKKTCYIYFDNDAQGYAVENALELKKLCKNI